MMRTAAVCAAALIGAAILACEARAQATVWVYKPDGSKQCEQGGGIPLERTAEELRRLGPRVLRAEKRTLCGARIAMCGAPTGRVNAMLIPTSDWDRLKRSFVGARGFIEWRCAQAGMPGLPPGPPPGRPPIARPPEPTQIRELIGRPLRVYRQGDPLTKDFRPDRVNIELDRGGRIHRIWFG